jgi:hypothetical protein
VQEVAQREPTLGRRIFAAMEKPFSTYALEPQRQGALLKLASTISWPEYCQRALKPGEPFPRWEHDYLMARYLCYEANKDPMRQQAMTDFEEFLSAEPSPLWDPVLPDAGAVDPARLDPARNHGGANGSLGHDENDKAPVAAPSVVEEHP